MVTIIGSQHLSSNDGSVSYRVVGGEDVDWLEIPTFMGHLYWRWAFNGNIDIERQLGAGCIHIKNCVPGMNTNQDFGPGHHQNSAHLWFALWQPTLRHWVQYVSGYILSSSTSACLMARCAILYVKKRWRVGAGADNPRYATGPSITLNIFHQLVHAHVWRRYDKLNLCCLRLPARLCWLHQLLKAITSTHNYRIVAASVSAVSRFNHLSCCKESPTSAVICATSGPLEPALEWTSVIVVSGWQKNNTVWTRVGFLLTGSTVLGVHW